MRGRLHQAGALALLLGQAGCEEARAPSHARDAGRLLPADAGEILDAKVLDREDGGEPDADGSMQDVGTAPATNLFTGRLVYEARAPNASFTNWSTLNERPARGFLVRSYRGEVLLDEARTSDDPSLPGEFAIRVPREARDGDELVFLAARIYDGEFAYAVADPGFYPSALPHALFEPKPSARVWSFRFAVRELSPDDTLRITEADGSGAAHVFDALQRGYAVYADHASEPLHNLVVWLGMGTRFQCGTCMASSPTDSMNSHFLHQVWLDGGSDQRYWSEALSLHEFGHFVMNALSHPATEGGPHAVGQPTHPGQAFNEGWATFFSSALRADALYYDKQQSKLFYADLAARRYSEGLPAWQRPEAALGLSQRIDENEVAALLWQVHARVGSLGTLLTALTLPRMREPPFARLYTRRVWSDPQHLDDYQDTGEPHAHLADLFDALRCAGALTAAELDAVTLPEQHYPYPSDQPLCDAD